MREAKASWSARTKVQGLEADVVILCDFSGLGNLFTVSDSMSADPRDRI